MDRKIRLDISYRKVGSVSCKGNPEKRIKSDAMDATVSLMEKQILDNVSAVINTHIESTGEVFEEITCRREQPKKPLITI